MLMNLGSHYAEAAVLSPLTPLIMSMDSKHGIYINHEVFPLKE